MPLNLEPITDNVIPSMIHIIFSITSYHALAGILELVSKNLNINITYVHLVIALITIITLWKMNRMELVGSVSPDDKSTGNKKKFRQLTFGLIGILYWVIVWPILENLTNGIQQKYNLNPVIFNIFLMIGSIYALNKYNVLNQIL